MFITNVFQKKVLRHCGKITWPQNKSLIIENTKTYILQPTGSQLQDRVAALEAERDALKASGASAGQSASDPASQSGDAAQSAVVARLRLDLAEALGTQERLQSRLGLAESELERLRAKTAEDAKTIRTLNTQCVSLSTKVKDRNEELQGKSKLVEVLTARRYRFYTTWCGWKSRSLLASY